MYLALKEHGFIVRRVVEQLHCSSCALFLADRYISGTCPHCQSPEAKGDQCEGCGRLLSPEELLAPRCLICGAAPKPLATEHAYFDLEKIQPETERWLDEAKGDWDENAKAIARAWLKQGLRARCITRDLQWGVPVPDMPGKVFYVWFDAPIGYLSITAKAFPAAYLKWWQSKEVKLYQFMGKDNVPFHSVIFPSTCLGSRLGWTMPHKMAATEYLNYEGGKFSKSRQLGVFGDSVQALGVAAEVWRYYLLVNRPEKADADFSWADFLAKNNNELLPNLGNLCNRLLQQIHKARGVPEPGELQPLDGQLVEDLEGKFLDYSKKMDRTQLKDGLKLAMEMSALGNKYVQEAQPWEKAVKATNRHLTVLFVGANLLKFLSGVFEPFMPTFAAKLNYLLGQQHCKRDRTLIGEFRQASADKAFRKAFLSLLRPGQQTAEPILIFREFSAEEGDKWKAMHSGKQEKD